MQYSSSPKLKWSSHIIYVFCTTFPASERLLRVWKNTTTITDLRDLIVLLFFFLFFFFFFFFFFFYFALENESATAGSSSSRDKENYVRTKRKDEKGTKVHVWQCLLYKFSLTKRAKRSNKSTDVILKPIVYFSWKTEFDISWNLQLLGNPSPIFLRRRIQKTWNHNELVVSSRKHAYIIFIPLNPIFYIIKLGLTGVYIFIFLFFFCSKT